MLKVKRIRKKNFYAFISSELDSIIESNNEEIKNISLAIKKQSRLAMTRKLNELKAKNILSNNKDAIKKKRETLVEIHRLDKAIQSTNTSALSKKKSELSENLITNHFISNFNNELESLNLSYLKASLEKVKTSYGKTLHKVLIKGSKTDIEPKEVLSGGEYKMISIAAFLADIELRSWKAPIIFDDPITSLSEDYENYLARRIIKLSKKSQVIIFSHRISFLYLMEELSKERNIEMHSFCLQRESWGVGEPTNLPFKIQNFPDTLKNLKARLEDAKTSLEKSGIESYRKLSASIERDLRIILEAIIERVMINKVVLRFKISITTSELKELAKINIEDCNLIDSLMTKYSYGLHLAPESTPKTDITPDELECDINSLLEWYKEFKKRPVLKNTNAHIVDAQTQQDIPSPDLSLL